MQDWPFRVHEPPALGVPPALGAPPAPRVPPNTFPASRTLKPVELVPPFPASADTVLPKLEPQAGTAAHTSESIAAVRMRCRVRKCLTGSAIGPFSTRWSSIQARARFDCCGTHVVPGMMDLWAVHLSRRQHSDTKSFVSHTSCVNTNYRVEGRDCEVVDYRSVREWPECSVGVPTFTGP